MSRPRCWGRVTEDTYVWLRCMNGDTARWAGGLSWSGLHVCRPPTLWLAHGSLDLLTKDFTSYLKKPLPSLRRHQNPTIIRHCNTVPQAGENPFPHAATEGLHVFRAYCYLKILHFLFHLKCEINCGQFSNNEVWTSSVLELLVLLLNLLFYWRCYQLICVCWFLVA